MKTKILVVDDELDICEVISNYFGRKGYAIITATSAREALSKVSSEKPDLILLDILMPEIDGIECLRMIRELDKDVPVVMVTVVDDSKTAKRAIKSGATDYITKPLTFSALETVIVTHLFMHSVK